MQALLHHALASSHAFGMLAGQGSTIEAIYPVTENSLIVSPGNHGSAKLQQTQPETGPLTLMGVYQATDSDGNISPEQTYQLSSYFEKQSGKVACCHLLLELGTEGRLDALMFSDPEHSIPIPLDMQEDECSVPGYLE